MVWIPAVTWAYDFHFQVHYIGECLAVRLLVKVEQRHHDETCMLKKVHSPWKRMAPSF